MLWLLLALARAVKWMMERRVTWEAWAAAEERGPLRPFEPLFTIYYTNDLVEEVCTRLLALLPLLLSLPSWWLKKLRSTEMKNGLLKEPRRAPLFPHKEAFKAAVSPSSSCFTKTLSFLCLAQNWLSLAQWPLARTGELQLLLRIGLLSGQLGIRAH